MTLTERIAIGCLLVAASAGADAAIVGPAADYGVFVFGTGMFSSQNTESDRSIAAGGNVKLENYSVASAIAGNPAAPVNPARLVVGGNLTATNGGVGQGQNGSLYVGGTISLTSFTATGGQHGQSLVNFAAAKTQYENLSTTWGNLAATGTSSLLDSTLTLTGVNAGLNVFSLTAAQLTNSNTVNINAPTGSTVLINVSGDDAVFQNGQVFLNGGISSAYVMYNFINATSVNLSGSKNPMGSILAPLAGVTGGYGAMDGQLITGTYGGSGGDPYGHTEFHGVVFAGDIPTPVPLPAAGWLLLSAIAGVWRMVRRSVAGATGNLALAAA